MASNRKIVETAGAPAAVGPYSQAVIGGSILLCSGQIPLDPITGDLVGADVATQAEQCLKNLEAVCAAAGTALAQALKLTVYLRDMEDFGAVNDVYAGFFADEPPARVTVAVAGLPKGAKIEIDAMVGLGS